jgi:hypothetical protein
MPKTLPKTVSKTMPKTMPKTVPKTVPKTMPKTVPKTMPKTVPKTMTMPKTGKNNAKTNAKYNARTSAKLAEYHMETRLANGMELKSPTMSAANIEQERVMLVQPLIESIDAVASEIMFGISGMSQSIDGFNRVRCNYPTKVI